MFAILTAGAVCAVSVAVSVALSDSLCVCVCARERIFLLRSGFSCKLIRFIASIMRRCCWKITANSVVEIENLIKEIVSHSARK